MDDRDHKEEVDHNSSCCGGKGCGYQPDALFPVGLNVFKPGTFLRLKSGDNYLLFMDAGDHKCRLISSGKDFGNWQMANDDLARISIPLDAPSGIIDSHYKEETTVEKDAKVYECTFHAKGIAGIQIQLDVHTVGEAIQIEDFVSTSQGLAPALDGFDIYYCQDSYIVKIKEYSLLLNGINYPLDEVIVSLNPVIITILGSNNMGTEPKEMFRPGEVMQIIEEGKLSSLYLDNSLKMSFDPPLDSVEKFQGQSSKLSLEMYDQLIYRAIVNVDQQNDEYIPVSITKPDGNNLVEFLQRILVGRNPMVVKFGHSFYGQFANGRLKGVWKSPNLI